MAKISPGLERLFLYQHPVIFSLFLFLVPPAGQMVECKFFGPFTFSSFFFRNINFSHLYISIFDPHCRESFGWEALARPPPSCQGSDVKDLRVERLSGFSLMNRCFLPASSSIKPLSVWMTAAPGLWVCEVGSRLQCPSVVLQYWRLVRV